MWFVYFMRIVRPLVQQSWAARAAATISLLSLTGGLVGWLVHWPDFFRFLVWGIIWALVAVGAWAINR